MELRESAIRLTKRLAQTAQETFGDFEEAVEKDATKTAVLDGTVHPLTSYVINYVKFLFKSEAKDLLGDDWVLIHRRIVQWHANQYKRVSWAMVVTGVLLSRAMVKDQFKTFNVQFEELHQRQSQWMVHDSELRESLRLAVAEVLLPAYRAFIKPMIENGKNPQKYIRFHPETIESMLNEFFESKTWSEPKQ
ncbi:exocyst complex component EXO70A1-like [Prunus yedoensis var. nudiflora]|uniref:Exocyst subunit Exo70 family protein n=1 Tax=Prunus yedoensis var. nudiflora TaxID=2094558 RepID=A0A314V0Q2_PRUYE|nr:exocyst complex component EXO70A1-like [Prunus yedoensis var. nudiflora]